MGDGEAGGRSVRRSTGYAMGVLSAANVYAMLVRLAGVVLAARFVEPDEFGRFNGMALALTYAPLFQAGIINALNRELPFFMGKGELERARSLAACTLAWALMVGVLTALAAAGFGLWQGTSLGDWQAAAGWSAMAVGLFCLFPSSYLQSTMRTGSEFTRLAQTSATSATASLVMVAAVFAFGFWGLCLRYVVCILIDTGMLWHWRPVRVRPRFRWGEFRHLAVVGVPIFAAGYSYSAWRGLDQFFILNAWGQEPLGYYQIAVMTGTAGALLANAASQVLYPRMTQEYGRTGDGMAALRVCLRPLLLITLGVIPMTVAGWLLLPPVVEWLLPKYVPGIAAAQWTLLSVAFLCVSQALSLFMVLRRMLAYGLVIGLGAAGFLATLPWLAEQNPDSPVTGVAQAMAVGVGIYLLAGNVIGVYIARQRGVAGMGGKVEP